MSPAVAEQGGPMRLAVVIPFLNEESFLPELLASMAAQTRPPDELLLVDDGSSDASQAIVQAFAAEHPYATALKRPRPVDLDRRSERDRLAAAAEYAAFLWGVEQLSQAPDIVVKMDADLRLTPTLFEAVEQQMAADPKLGVTGTYLSVVHPDGELRREFNPPDNVRGPNKCYRWACFEEILPLKAQLGWEMVDELKARIRGWSVRSFELPEGDPVHLRPTGLHDGRLRAFRRWGACAWGYGQHPLVIVGGGVMRFSSKPYVLGGLSYILGWAMAGLRRAPRADSNVRAFVRREKLRYVASCLRRPNRALFLKP